jgi:hypothetical protein
MSEETPERLKQFRAENHRTTAAPTRLLLVNVVIFVVGMMLGMAGLAALQEDRGAREAGPAGGLSLEQQKRLALYLEEKQLPNRAIDAYTDYLERASLDNAARAKVCYSIAKLALDTEHYEQALASLYEAEMLDPASDLKPEIDRKIVLCLDKLGRAVDLKRELRRRTDIKRSPEDLEPGEVVLAEFAGQVITDRDLELEIEKLPAAAQDAMAGPDKKVDLLRNIVAERLLLDKAHRLELDKDPEIQEQLAAQRDAMIVRKLIGDEVRAKVVVSPEDVQRFYKAESDRFTQPAAATVTVGTVAGDEVAWADKPVRVREGGRMPGAPVGPDAIAAVFEAEPGMMTDRFEADGATYTFRVESKEEAELLPFDEVKEQAARMLQMQKEQEQVQVLIEETLQARDVRLHPERLTKETGEQ